MANIKAITWKSILALLIIVFIPFGLMLWIRMHQSTGFAVTELIAYPLLFGGGSIILLLLLKKFLLKEKLSDFNTGEGSWSSDIGWGLLLTIIYFVLFFVERLTLVHLLPFRSNTELMQLMLDMRENALLVMLWFGPVLWIGIALYEELIRVFLLLSLWKWSENKVWIGFTILLSAAIIGLAHWSQGPYGIVTIGIKSIVIGYFFYKKRRLMPLVYAHVLYDGLQVGMFLLTYEN
ncbi:CPBP family intramembrane metalloprotease [Prolixibacteraceae bacterium JC049]|nr:CPBP family intramembrane metalloprotease [Prolixibacteraceae bacterium JC049]